MANLFEAIEEVNLEKTRQLLENGAQVNCYNYNQLTPLDCAIKKKSKEIFNLLLSHGANVNYGYNDGAIQTAIYEENVEIIKILLDHGANVDCSFIYDITTPLQRAILLNRIEIVKLLLQYGANVNYQDFDLETPLHKAVKIRNGGIICLLLEHGADVNLKENAYDTTPLEKSVYTKSFSCKNILLTHVLKLVATNKKVSQDNLNCLHREMQLINSTWQLEVEKLKKSMIHENYNFSYYDLLTKKTEDIARFLRNDEVREKFKNADCYKVFPVYYGMFAYRIRKALKLNNIFFNGLNLIFSIVSQVFPLPVECVLEIHSHFEENEIKSLIKTFKNSI